MEFPMIPNRFTDNLSINPPPPPPPPPPSPFSSLSPQDIRYMIDHISQEKQIQILQTSAFNNPDVLTEIRDAVDHDITLRKLFIRCLSTKTTSTTLHAVFSPFGIIQEAVVIYDKVTGRSKCYGFITFKHVDSAILAMKNPSKRIDGRMTMTQLASVGLLDNIERKIFIKNIPFQISSDELLNHFLKYGEVEEGPIAFDNDSNKKARGFTFFVYKTKEAAQAAVCVPLKVINGYTVNCKMAIDNKKSNQKQGTSLTTKAAASSGFSGDAMSRQMLQQQLYLPVGGFEGISPMSQSPLVNSIDGGGGGSNHNSSGGYEHGVGGYYSDYGERCSPSLISVAANGSQRRALHHQEQGMVPERELPRGMYYVRYPYL